MFTELLLKKWNHLSPSDLMEWEAQAQKVNDAEFTALLEEEWEKLSAAKKKTAAQEARQEDYAAKVVQAEAKVEAEAAEVAALDPMATNAQREPKQRLLESKQKELTMAMAALSVLEDAKAAQARARAQEAAARASGGSGGDAPNAPNAADADADADAALFEPTAKMVWMFKERAMAEEASSKEWTRLPHNKQRKHSKYKVENTPTTRSEQKAKAPALPVDVPSLEGYIYASPSTENTPTTRWEQKAKARALPVDASSWEGYIYMPRH